LMRMGCLPTNAFYSPTNMLHVLLDNQSHDSTGGQFTAASGCDFVRIAAASGYRNVIYAHGVGELRAAAENWMNFGELTFIYLRISSGSMANLGRPKITPSEVQTRFAEFLIS
jgi:phosphonopyruvate decarboxylase